MALFANAQKWYIFKKLAEGKAYFVAIICHLRLVSISTFKLLAQKPFGLFR
jgi:hypothetical protein